MAQQGDKRAFQELEKKHRPFVASLCERFFEPNRAQDACQATMLKAFTSIQSFKGDAKFSSWLFTVARNVCLNLKEGDKVSVEWDRLDSGTQDSIMSAGSEDASNDPADVFMAGEDYRTALHKLRTTLSEQDMMIVVSRYQWEMDWDEIAKQLGKSSGYLRKRWSETILPKIEAIRVTPQSDEPV